jgi:flagella basal body P-ring formation protein FlgA
MSRISTFFLLLLVGCASALAAGQPLQTEAIERFVADEAAAVVSLGAGVRIEVEVGRLDPRLRLTPCGKIEPFIPSGARLWGRSNVGLRCVANNSNDGAGAARWQVFFPVTVRVYGPAPVAARPIAAGEPFGAEDLVTAEVEWTRESQGILTDVSQLDGRVTSRPVAAGQPISLAVLRARQVIAPGDQVRMVGRGVGFSVTGQAVALAAAQDGQSVRVRLDSGRILTGTARAGRWVEVTF